MCGEGGGGEGGEKKGGMCGRELMIVEKQARSD